MKKPTCTLSYGGLFRSPPYENVHVGLFIHTSRKRKKKKDNQFLNDVLRVRRSSSPCERSRRRVITEKSMRTELFFFFFFFFFRFDPRFFLLSLLFPSSFLLFCLVHFTARLFGSHASDLGRVILPR